RVLHLMTQSVIEQAFRKFSKTHYEFSINITRDDLYMNYLENFLLKNCKKFNIDPSRVVLEILEDIVTLQEKNILDQLNIFRERGFQVAVDDFGAENSNFSRLLEFKPNYLKIDGAFVKNIVDDFNSRLITESITYICKKSDLKIIAEYIHNKEVLEVIKEIGIDYSQGYYIGAPSVDLVEVTK
ncbi:MAG: EAL domain-containing protein, partial [Campylobacterota bacterium]|nr:EAL domain-containing protein [Campylobacterota bacterium]